MIYLVREDVYKSICDVLGIEKSTSHRTEKIRKLITVNLSKGKSYQAYRWVKLQEKNDKKINANADKLENLLNIYSKNLSQSVRDWVSDKYKGCKKKYYKIAEPETGHIYSGVIYEHPNRKHDDNYFKEKLQAVILSSLGFKVYLIEEPSTGSKKIDAIVNGVPIDFKKSKNQQDKEVDDSIQNNYQKGMKKYNCNGVFVHVIENKPTQVRRNKKKVHLPLNEAIYSMSKDGNNGILSVWVETEQKFYSHDLKKIREVHNRASHDGIDN